MYTNKSVVEYYKNKNLYWSELFNSWCKKVPWSKSLVESYYNEARKVYLLEMTFDQFYEALVYPDEARYRSYRWRRWKRKYTSEYYYREKRGYKKKPEHKKKELTVEEQNKRAWKKKKKDPRNQCRNWYKSKWHRKNGYRRERHHVRSELKKRDFKAYSLTLKTWIEDSDYEIIRSEDWYLPNEWDDFTLRKRESFCNSWDWY